MELYIFGWRRLGAALREHAWFYLPLAAIAAGLSLITRWTAQLSATDIGVLAFIPALAFATRLARPSIAIRERELFGLIAIWAIVDGSFWVFMALARVWDLLLIVALFLFVPYLWIAVKLTLARAIYLLKSPSASIMDAFSGSYDYVEGETWWRIVGLQLLILLPAFLITFWMLRWQTTFGGAFIIAGLTIVTTVWTQISLVAMASNTGVPEEHTDAVTV